MLRFDPDLGLDCLAAMTNDLAELGVQIRRGLQRAPTMPVGAQRVREHERVEAVVLARRGAP